jgi:3-dehydroquinate synthetase
MYAFLSENGVTRSDCVVALGGGVTGDMAGFTAATYLRGIDYYQIPTSLLAQVDSSVGGKTAVDLPSGKNLVGAFCQPEAVFIDPDTLKTLPEAFFTDGLGEVLKYGMIRSERILNLMETHDRDSIKSVITEIICECVAIKAEIVANDEYEQGERKLLNFGHTFGHAIERLEHFSGLSHGLAVVAGMKKVTEIAGLSSGLFADSGVDMAVNSRTGITVNSGADMIANSSAVANTSVIDTLNTLSYKYGLTRAVRFTDTELLDAAMTDKKRSADGIDLVICTKPGASTVEHIKITDLRKIMQGE